MGQNKDMLAKLFVIACHGNVPAMDGGLRRCGAFWGVVAPGWSMPATCPSERRLLFVARLVYFA
jgi:hypothetical protein